MFVPHSYGLTLLMLIISMVCWGSWANMQKLDPALRFELFYWDYVWAIVVLAVLAGLTLGRLRPDAPNSFFNNICAAAPLHIAEAVAGGIVFNAGNILLVAAIALGGMAVAFPIGAGLGLVIGAVLNYLVTPAGNAELLFGGVAFVCAAIVFDAIAYRSLPGSGAAGNRAIGLSIASGVLIGLFYPLVAKSLSGVQALTPYTTLVFFAGGVVASNVLFNGWLMRRPIRGPRLRVRDYVDLSGWAHLLGWIGGTLWTIGTVANFVASAVPMVGPAVSFSLGEGNTLISAIWGVFVWREFRGGGTKTKTSLAFMFICFVVGLAAIAFAPLKG